MIDVENNIARLNERISCAAGRAGRSPAEITLVAVTKSVPAEKIAEAWGAGLREFGENRVQEAEPKILWSRERGLGLNWHMVGHLQRNKVKKAIQLFDVIQSVDSLPLAHEMSQRCAQAPAVRLPILLEVNVSGEASKYGFAAHEGHGRLLDDFLRAVQEIVALPHLEPQGLMTVAPFGAPEEDLRSCFRRVRSLLHRLREQLPNQQWQHLSMGMTDDFEVAIEEGATILRIGRAIFGERRKH
ncbi:MAG: YggS family pyridoxal phosphate-dependent enzyme, partial [Anaerolineae bacterium]|nr:YggS family pyridoxal phosphate-dependent enzyme [Anaerolineae bacterium]